MKNVEENKGIETAEGHELSNKNFAGRNTAVQISVNEVLSLFLRNYFLDKSTENNFFP